MTKVVILMSILFSLLKPSIGLAISRAKLKAIHECDSLLTVDYLRKRSFDKTQVLLQIENLSSYFYSAEMLKAIGAADPRELSGLSLTKNFGSSDSLRSEFIDRLLLVYDAVADVRIRRKSGGTMAVENLLLPERLNSPQIRKKISRYFSFSDGQFNVSLTETQRLKIHVLRRIFEAYEFEKIGKVDHAWAALEEAHIIGQIKFWTHMRVHQEMLDLAIRTDNRKEIRGQRRRIFATRLAHSRLAGLREAITGRSVLPVGNRGSSDVSPIAREPISPKLRELMDNP
ncbi:MAG: DUF3703 domain-containing protein [Bdellovibrionota bacterium]